jgi:hypothetical protein
MESVMSKAYAQIKQSRFGWWASYHTKSDTRMFGMDYIELSNFSFTKRGIERKARRRIRKLQDSIDRSNNTYEIYGVSDE